VTYAQLDKVLSYLGFTVRVVTGEKKLRVYEHKGTGASIALAYRPDKETVLPHHLAAVQGTLKVYGIADALDFAAYDSCGKVTLYLRWHEFKDKEEMARFLAALGPNGGMIGAHDVELREKDGVLNPPSGEDEIKVFVSEGRVADVEEVCRDFGVKFSRNPQPRQSGARARQGMHLD
jgi:hypothetical protein